MQFETNFGVVALQFLEEDRQRENAPSAAAITPSGWIVVGSGPSSGMEAITHTSSGSGSKNPKALRPSFSTSQLNTFASTPHSGSGKTDLFKTVCILQLFLHINLFTPRRSQSRNETKSLNSIYEGTAEEVSFECLHRRISSIELKVRITF